MALTTGSIRNNEVDQDNTPEYYTAFDKEGKGYLAKRKVEAKVEEPKVEEPKVEESKPKSKKKRSKK